MAFLFINHATDGRKEAIVHVRNFDTSYFYAHVLRGSVFGGHIVVAAVFVWGTGRDCFMFWNGAYREGKTLDKKALREAIYRTEHLKSKGGTLLYVPIGVYLIQSYNLRSRVTFYLAKGGIIKSSQFSHILGLVTLREVAAMYDLFKKLGRSIRDDVLIHKVEVDNSWCLMVIVDGGNRYTKEKLDMRMDMSSLLQNGYCHEKGENISVYEYASRGSLDRWLMDDGLTWRKRLEICIDIASGLAFLHGTGDTKKEVVIHRDIKSANVLIHGDWKAKIDDFGLSLISPVNTKMSYVIDNAKGTPGYCDPQYIRTQVFTRESDIYSFGVLLFEMLCGRFVM
ncbi:kinase RLK-Pelle-LRR-I-1 family protein [Tanacetum coccineum]